MARHFRSALTALLLGFLLVVASGSVGAQAALTAPTIPVAPNTTTPFLGAGFVAGEPVSLWMSAPDGTVVPLDGAIADSQGAISVSVSFPTAGIWNVTAHGQTSAVQVIGTFAVGTTSGLPATPGLVRPGRLDVLRGERAGIAHRQEQHAGPGLSHAGRQQACGIHRVAGPACHARLVGHIHPGRIPDVVVDGVGVAHGLTMAENAGSRM
jgi:hypothetical protein